MPPNPICLLITEILLLPSRKYQHRCPAPATGRNLVSGLRDSFSNIWTQCVSGKPIPLPPPLMTHLRCCSDVSVPVPSSLAASQALRWQQDGVVCPEHGCVWAFLFSILFSRDHLGASGWTEVNASCRWPGATSSPLLGKAPYLRPSGEAIPHIIFVGEYLSIFLPTNFSYDLIPPQKDILPQSAASFQLERLFLAGEPWRLGGQRRGLGSLAWFSLL